jgi:hypothetical protein
VLSWDGATQDGEIVPTGVYLLRLSAAGERIIRKIIIRER